MPQADIGLIGLAVMGQNLVLNISDHGYSVAVYNRSRETTEGFAGGDASGRDITACYSLEDLVGDLKAPRKVMLMVRAGAPVDQLIEQLIPLLSPGDIIIDGGNSRFTDTNRRVEKVAAAGLHFLGCGISGGEEGARNGPSVMPGGDRAAWPEVRPIFQAIAAQVDDQPCCQWVGEAGSGHYVKMVHNGIEYGDMQLISEAFHLMRQGLGLEVDRIQQVFTDWNQGVLDSYLIEITAEILRHRDSDGAPLVDKILDAAGQKGTGKWTGISALDLGIPLTLITEAVFSRCLSSLKVERTRAAEVYASEPVVYDGDAGQAVADLHDALYAAKIISYTQGYMLMQEAAKEYGWKLNYGDVALMWRGGCIIRSRFLGNIKEAFEADPGLDNLLMDPFFIAAIKSVEPGWRRTVARGIELGLPLPALGSSLSFFDGYRSAQLPANLLQAQRDYFGAHTYERTDRPRGEFFHTDWTGRGGDAASTTYNV
jgi:6-phosphogluconate dehydrogenase